MRWFQNYSNSSPSVFVKRILNKRSVSISVGYIAASKYLAQMQQWDDDLSKKRWLSFKVFSVLYDMCHGIFMS